MADRTLARAARSGVALVALVLACAAGAAPAAAQQVAAASPTAESSRLWSFIDRRAQEIEPLWRPDRHLYVMASGRLSTRLISNMLELHAYAAIAGHVGPSRHDERIEPLADLLTTYPAFVETSKVRLSDNQFHTPGWFADPLHFPSDQHVALDSQVAESLECAWQARGVAQLSARVRSAIQRAIRLTAWSPFFRYPGIRLNQFNWYSDLYEADAAVNGRTYLVRHDYRSQLVRFLDHIQRAWPGGTTNLNVGFGLHYLPHHQAESGANRVSTTEYEELIFHATENYAPALAAGMTPLDPARLTLLRAWARRALYGEWTHAGFLNWDTGLAYARWQLTRYWSFALSGLGSLGTAPILTAEERSWARWMFDRALLFYEGYQAGEPRPEMPTALFGVHNIEAMPADDPLFIASRTAMTVAQRAVQGFEETSAEKPPPLYAYDWDIRRLAVTTPVYSTAVLDQTFAGRYGGVDLARLFDGRGRPLGTIGGSGAYGFGLRVVQPGHPILLDTEPGGRTARWFNGPGVKRAPFQRPIALSARVDRGGAQVLVQHRFAPASITTTYRVLGPRSAVTRIRFPVWARIEAPQRPTVTVQRGGLTVRVAQSAGGYTATVRAAGNLSTQWRPLVHRINSTPGTGGVLEVVVPLRNGRTTATVVLRPERVA